jgi:3-phenylpropionate/trans-cinnamate dioxygenase ferredoxin subunit
MTDTNVEFHEVGNDGDIEEEGAIQVTVGKTDIAIYRLEGELYASDDICTHAYASLADGFIEDGQVECPLHGACFDIKTGKAMTAPASIDLRTYPVKVENGKVLVGVPAA